MFSHERLDVYRLAVEFLALVVELLDSVPRCNAAVCDQFRRAALSIPLNIAEGAGRIGVADQARFYATARGSSLECAAILDALRVMQLADQDRVDTGKAVLARIAAMLTKMCR